MPKGFLKFFTRPIVQLDDKGELIKVWSCFNDIKEYLEEREYVLKQGIANAIRKGIRCKGYFWMHEDTYKEWIKEKSLPIEERKIQGPNFNLPKRYLTVYAYEPYNRKEIHRDNYSTYKVEKQNMIFINRYPNAVIASKKIGISVSNIRDVLKGSKNLHKGYYFSFIPLHEDDDLIADAKEDEDI